MVKKPIPSGGSNNLTPLKPRGGIAKSLASPAGARGSIGSPAKSPAGARGSIGSPAKSPAGARGFIGSPAKYPAGARGFIGSPAKSPAGHPKQGARGPQTGEHTYLFTNYLNTYEELRKARSHLARIEKMKLDAASEGNDTRLERAYEQRAHVMKLKEELRQAEEREAEKRGSAIELVVELREELEKALAKGAPEFTESDSSHDGGLLSGSSSEEDVISTAELLEKPLPPTDAELAVIALEEEVEACVKAINSLTEITVAHPREAKVLINIVGRGGKKFGGVVRVASGKKRNSIQHNLNDAGIEVLRV